MEELVAKTSARKGEFTGDLGQLLADARSKAEGWLDQRESISKQLLGIRDAAMELLRQLGHETTGGGRKSSRRADGSPRRKRKLSAAGRAAIVAAQKARWARVRAAKR